MSPAKSANPSFTNEVEEEKGPQEQDLSFKKSSQKTPQQTREDVLQTTDLHTQEETRDFVNSIVLPNSPAEIETEGSMGRIGIPDFQRQSQRNGCVPKRSTEITKEQYSIETERQRHFKEFLIKKKTPAQYRYFRNNANLYQCESDLRSKGIKSVKQQSNYMKAIKSNALSPIRIENREHRVKLI